MSFTLGDMKLDAFLNARKITDAEFAASIQVSRSMVTKLRAGTASPSARTALAIEAATERQVTLTDLLPQNSGEGTSGATDSAGTRSKVLNQNDFERAAVNAARQARG